MECLPADKPWDAVSATRRSSGVAPRACVRVYARVLVPPNLYIHTYTEFTGRTIHNRKPAILRLINGRGFPAVCPFG